MYMNPSSTSGVATRFSLPDVPPIATAKASLRFLTLPLLIVSSGEKRCEPKSWWFMSQFCGSGLRRRSKVTSAALTAQVVASRATVSAVRKMVVFGDAGIIMDSEAANSARIVGWVELLRNPSWAVHLARKAMGFAIAREDGRKRPYGLNPSYDRSSHRGQ